ncbi:HNH endonuclease signature motif containing protein [Mycolicibacterium sp. F2034L]|uniref:HNH endonuclease signature motif containing protein n=1 Tax=Mycolicibacterium sp. F2034L TaxID=2926422 RepID=UPI001FF245A2|nr:HNH endonuclease signature motif containing protein [Mycolicibacterium sp. F2034L]MCK0177462.1 HNH endonuclease [Mycolicibacterium sp. F2034L]
MFDTVFGGRDDAALIAVIEQAAREEAVAGARKLAALAQLVHQSVTFDEERDDWACDSWATTASEVGAVLNVGYRKASAQMRIALALRDRLPNVAALCLQGRLSARMIATITWRSRLIIDADTMALIDAALADKAQRWEPLSDERLINAIDALIHRYDPDAVTRAKEALRRRTFRIGAHDDPDELTTIWGHILGCEAAVLAARIAALLTGLCDDDPRSIDERRSCAMGAILLGQPLPCRCGNPACTATAPDTSHIVINVVADPTAITAAHKLIATEDHDQRNAHAKRRTQPEAEAEAGAERSAEEEREPEPEAGSEVSNPPACPQDSGTALMPDGTILPILALAETIRAGARIKPLQHPGPDPEPHYQPSAKLAAFVRARDLFCRFPGCHVPAARCDIDHVVPWPYGPTHPSNLHCKCRTHHLAKTFWDGWGDEQSPDGTITWTTPAGAHYTTTPGSRLFFPGWDTTTTELPPLAKPPPDPDRIAKMPKRRRTRAADRAARITAERAHNAAQRQAAAAAAAAAHAAAAARAKHPPAEPQPLPNCSDDDPPPF